MQEDYKYTFKYQCNDKIYEMTFNADIDLEELKQNLMYFLRGCSWSERSTAFLEEDPEEAIRSAVMSEQYDRIAAFIKEAKEQCWSAETILEQLERKYIC